MFNEPPLHREDRLRRTLAPLMILPLFGVALFAAALCPDLLEARFVGSVGVAIEAEGMGLDRTS